MMDKFQLEGEFNVEEIVKTIKRKALQEGCNVPSIYEKLLQEGVYETQRITRILTEMQELAKVEMDYKIKSHRYIVGWVVIFFKKVIRFMVKLSLAPIYQKQERFNIFIVETLHYIIQRLENVEKIIKKNQEE